MGRIEMNVFSNITFAPKLECFSNIESTERHTRSSVPSTLPLITETPPALPSIMHLKYH